MLTLIVLWYGSDDLEIKFDEEADQKYLSMEELGNTLKCLTDYLEGRDWVMWIYLVVLISVIVYLVSVLFLLIFYCFQIGYIYII